MGANADAAIIQLDNLAVVVTAPAHPLILSGAVLGGFMTDLNLDAAAPVLQLDPALTLEDDHLGAIDALGAPPLGLVVVTESILLPAVCDQHCFELLTLHDVLSCLCEG